MVVIRHSTGGDWLAIEQLLRSADLPLDGARESLDGFVVAEEDGGIVGCAAIERYGSVALLRSVAILSSHRGRRIGEKLVATIIQNARGGVQSVFLLTTTAAGWFPRFGFTAVSRNDVPDSLQGSAEFRGACPASAVVMTLALR